MFKSKGLTLTWLIIYSIIGVWGFFASVFALIAYAPYMAGLHGAVQSSGRTIVTHYFMEGTPILLLVSLILAWHYYGKKQYEKVWYAAPGLAIAYAATMFIALH